MPRHGTPKGGGAAWANGKHTGAGGGHQKHQKKQVADANFDYTQDLFDAAVSKL